MKIKIGLPIIVAVLVNLSACSYIKNLFPDKEKDYQFTTEIPPLVLPADLAGDSIKNVPAAPAAETVDAAPADPSTETAADIERKFIQIELVDAEDGAKRLHIGAPPNQAWRIVGKALSRNALEVTNRNQDQRFFQVQYEPNKQKVEDGSIWDEGVFFFVGLNIDEYEYVLKMVENNRQTDVVILDKEQKPVSDAGSLSLLTLLYDTIKADLAK
ncbi:outer membrane protein assembly factor BamC [Methylobacter sp. Wu8]|jgi:outer membrane protein assembly factor BamC|uniref:Outer membrane protein assembly factor BamC n=1 Tax=Methylobacter tundripaludum TaxID=173365 RepID=A0A2S6H6V4_9GAMM|nr:outer membrane protein assembly factor BamC [Methylobacter tundripaludum]MCF7965906.1 outer membrane protein assembly factor BamC [Methylobacter tundripaludum]MCK9634997.1 outer membrane protein assembly factor BamC [Methylobacter tundripaludum]PPK73207.1 outer membrane protein assembly factor BamC [Methylobacter tundripaludum]